MDAKVSEVKIIDNEIDEDEKELRQNEEEFKAESKILYFVSV